MLAAMKPLYLFIVAKINNNMSFVRKIQIATITQKSPMLDAINIPASVPNTGCDHSAALLMCCFVILPNGLSRPDKQGHIHRPDCYSSDLPVQYPLTAHC